MSVWGSGRVEWPTLLLIVGVYLAWAAGTVLVPTLSVSLAVVLLAPVVALFSSLQHEVLHGHPFRFRRLNEALVFPALTLVIPYGRFRDTHLAHHQDSILTDPFDDPESNYLDPGVWEQLPHWQRRVLAFNNTLFGRLAIGPLVSQVAFMRGDWRAIRAGDRSVRNAWLAQIPALALVAFWFAWAATMPFWAYCIAVYAGLSILKIRTFLEHRAAEHTGHRTVIIEDHGPLAFLFLNNNLHVVHHMHPATPWYRLPALYARNRQRYLTRNDGYRYASYGEIFRRYLFRAKDAVPHPLWRRS